MTAPTTPGATCACDEGRALELSRRGVLLALGGSALFTATLGDARLAFGAGAGSGNNVLVTIVLAGGADGLSIVPPVGDPLYAKARPSIAVPPSAAHPVDSTFGLHPALAPLVPLWTAGTLAAVHAVGQPSPTRSHFEAMDELERAAPNSSLRTGWLDRTLGLLPAGGALEAVALGDAGVPGHLRGPHATLAANSLDEVKLAADPHVASQALWTKAISQLHTGARPEVRGPMANALAAASLLSAKLPAASPGPAAPSGTPSVPSTTPAYPDDPFGKALADVARLVKADAGLRVASVHRGGWDYHTGFGRVDSGGGTFAGNLSTVATALAAFAADLGAALDRVTVVTLTEFGRRVAENGSYGLDHGHGTAMLVLGGGVNGGKVHGHWPGLQPAQLDTGIDLAGTTDYRSVLGEILVGRMGVNRVSDVFPGFRPAPVGVIRTA